MMMARCAFLETFIPQRDPSDQAVCCTHVCVDSKTCIFSWRCYSNSMVVVCKRYIVDNDTSGKGWRDYKLKRASMGGSVMDLGGGGNGG